MFVTAEDHLHLELDCSSCGARNVMTILEKWAKKGSPYDEHVMPCRYCDNGNVKWEPTDYTLMYRKKAIERLRAEKESLREEMRRYELAHITSEVDDLMYGVRQEILRQFEEKKEDVIEAYIEEMRLEDEYQWHQENGPSLCVHQSEYLVTNS